MEDFEDAEFVASEHDILVSAVSKLDKTQHIIGPTRNEPTNLNSEFNLIKRPTKLDLGKIADVLGDTAGHVQITKKLKRTQISSRVLPKPLEKPQVERIKRATGYAVTKKKVGRWDPVVARSRTADHVCFPLKHTSSKLQSTNEFLSKLQLKSDLERELDEVDPPTKAEEEEDDDQKTYPMSYEEMVEHRQNLAKFRAQESYKAAKAKRQSKIKSKKYHRILKKERLKQQLKEFEELQKIDPEEALKKLETLEKARALERHTLRHKNTGKWAKNNLIRAKYDTEARQQIAEQLAVSRSLTQKTQNDESTDDESENEAIPDITLTQDPMNPWMLKQNDKSNVNTEFEFGYKKYLKDKMIKQKEDSDSDDNEDVLETDNKTVKYGFTKIKESMDKIFIDKFGNNENFTLNKKPILESETESDKIKTVHDERQKDVNDYEEDKQCEVMKMHNSEVPLKKRKVLKSKHKILSKSSNKEIIATSVWSVECITDNNKTAEKIASAFDTLESNITKKVDEKLNDLRRGIQNLEYLTRDNKTQIRKQKEPRNNIEYLKLKNQKLKAIIDEELLETTSKTVPSMPVEVLESYKIGTVIETPAQVPVNTNIDPNRFIEVKPKYLNTALPGNENETDELDDEQVVPKVNIEEVFEEDDVVASFRQEKEDEINKDRPTEINLTLPGWGSWGGIGVKAPKRKKNRFITKCAPKIPRRDENKGDIIIKEYTDPKLIQHKVKEVPYPFQSVKEYEASIRAPLGNTFIPEKAHKKLIKPNVKTKAGAIIEPMDEDELLVKKNRTFQNDAIIKIISKK